MILVSRGGVRRRYLRGAVTQERYLSAQGATKNMEDALAMRALIGCRSKNGVESTTTVCGQQVYF
jgi:hypothetical protein